MTQTVSSENSSKNAHSHTHEFLDQISITDKKEQKQFFSNHRLNFFNLAQSNKNRKKRKTTGIINTILSLGFLAVIVNLCVYQSQIEVKRQIWQNTFDSSWHASDIGLGVPASIADQEENLVADIDKIIAHPVRDDKGHSYVPENILQAKVSAFYKSSILHDYGNLTKFEMLGFSLDSPFVSSQIKKTFA